MIKASDYLNQLPRPIFIIGMGLSGESCALLFKECGLVENADYYCLDEKNRAHVAPGDISITPKTILVSPGVSLEKEYIKNWISQGALLTSELTLAASFLKYEKCIGITGSIGKSTTTAALGQALRVEDTNVFAGGNFGIPLATYIYEVLTGIRSRAKYVVLELSSYQLENLENIRFICSAITYFTPNHLERYSSLEEYYQTKMKIVSLTDGTVFLNSKSRELIDYVNSSIIAPRSKYEEVKSEQVFFRVKRSDFSLKGSHNDQNLALVIRICDSLGITEAKWNLLKTFRGLKHRFEWVAETKGVIYINDSKATTIESVLTAAKSAVDQIVNSNTLHLLLGGRDKNLPWQDLEQLNQIRNIKYYFFGECAQLAQKKSTLSGDIFNSMNDALHRAAEKATSGDWVLLSPGGTSLDAYKNFEVRGDSFREECLKLK